MDISRMSLTRKGCAAAIPQGSQTGVEGEILPQELGIGMAEMLHWACAVLKEQAENT